MPKKPSRAHLYLQDRDAGMKYQEIAEKYGVSHQCVAQICARGGKRFRPYTEEEVVFPILRRWLNQNEVNRAEFVRRMGTQPYSVEITKLSKWLRGEHDPSKLYIDRMLGVTGLTYEQFFFRERADG